MRVIASIIYFFIDMGKIDENIIRSILERADIVEVVGDFLKLRKTGVRYTAICPFHEDRHDGNFMVYPKGNCFRCFACEAKGGAVEFLMRYCKMTYPDAIRWLGKKYCIDVDNIPMNFKLPPPPPPPPPLPMLELPMAWVTSHERTEGDMLCDWLRSLTWDGCQRRRLGEVMREYHIGHARQGHTIFWLIDEHGKVRTGKMMLYRKDGHRDKESKYNFDWIHALLFRKSIYDDNKVEVRPTLFGLHLLDRYPNASVNIVESEKTAIIMATAYGNNHSQLWMACGGVENLSREKLAPIIKENRRIILYPDRDAIDRWKEKATLLRYDRLTINVQAVKDWWKPEDGEKADIADVVVRMINEKKIYKTVEDVIQDIPHLKALHEKIQLEIMQ